MNPAHKSTDLAPYPLEIVPPNLSPWRAGNTGIASFQSFTATEPGPHVMVTALMHGNELCGAIVLDELLRSRYRPARGRLTLGFCNIHAYRSFDPVYPLLSRFIDEDMNRVWASDVLGGPGDSLELRRAREIRPLLDTVDFLLDIHSMRHPTAPLMLAGPLPKGRHLAEAVGAPATIVIDTGHTAGRRMRDYAAFSETASTRTALLVECGQHWSRESVTVARDTTIRFLVATGAANPELIEQQLSNAVPDPQRVIEVTQSVVVETGNFNFIDEFIGMEVIPKAGTLLATDGGRQIYTPHDDCVLIMPTRRLGKGQTAVRLGRYVD